MNYNLLLLIEASIVGVSVILRQIPIFLKLNISQTQFQILSQNGKNLFTSFIKHSTIIFIKSYYFK